MFMMQGKVAVSYKAPLARTATLALVPKQTKRSGLEGELQTLKSSSSTSTSEVETLRTRIASLESANRDTIAVLESKTTANDNLAQELQKQHQKGLELSQQITTLQQSVQNTNSAVSSARFREQSLKQEVELAKSNGEWFENELKTKNAEAQKYRKEKGARLAELQRHNEDLNSNLGALKKTEQALRARLSEVEKKAEDALSNVQRHQEAAAKAEEAFRQDLERAERLTKLQSQQSETHRNRLKEVEATLERIKDEAAEEVGRCRQEAETERQEREVAENRISELEAEVATVRLEAANARPGSVPGTPRQGLNGSVFGRSGSPAIFGTPGSTRGKSAITATQAIDELYKVKGQLSAEKLRSQRLATEMEEMLAGLEAKQPELEEMQNEHDRLQQEVVQMSKFVDNIGKERDRAKKDLRKAESEASTAHAESNILKTQLRDLSAQIKLLVCELDARDRGLEAMTASEKEQLERLARGEVSEEELEGSTDTDRFITERLRVFRNVSELQEKNQELLKVTRELGQQMESEEALSAKHKAAQDHEEVESLRGKIEHYKDELKSTLTRSESYIKERDMFRRMLQNRGQIPAGSDLASMFGQSTDGNQNGVVSTIEQGSGNSTSYPTLLRELQAHFDQYREEQSTDRRTMKEQTEKLSLEKGALQAEIAKTSSQLTLANERYEMLHANYTMLQNENSELQKRSQGLSEAAAKQDLRTQQVAEDLIEAKGMVESMRNENANLKAEKKLWKDIQDRLSQDNEALMNERSRLNNLVASQQTMQNERELNESETRRRLQTQVETLEAELSTTKRKLNDEIEDNKKAQLRKEYDSQQTQKRIDELASSLSNAREELVAAKTTRDHLQARVDELSIELKSAEERVELLQPRPTPRPVQNGDGSSNTDGEETNREQELAIELSEVKRDLDLAKSELESAKQQTEQYKSISQASEEELQSLNTTHDQYREEMDRLVEEKESKIHDLQQRVDDISAELTTTNNDLTLLRSQQNEVARQVDSDKAILEQEIARLKDEDERHAAAAQFHQQDLRAQAAIATKAQQDYENELVKHAEAAKLLQALRGDYNQMKAESAGLKADAESARVALSQSEASWDERRQQLEQELSELRTRRDDVNAQNKLLHQQLENFGTQLSALQQSRNALAESGESASPPVDSTYDRTAEGLRELNAFLRREKEIVEVQYELKVQEAKRLQQQLEYAQSQLDESRLKLDQERRSQADGGRSAIAHKDLMEKLNELNLFRESSITLRNEARQAQTQLTERNKRVEELMAQIQPLETKIRELEHGKETSEGEMRLLQEDRDRWQKRTQDIISKHDRIDPAEMEQLKETVENLEKERGTWLEEKQPLEEKIQALEGEKTVWQQSRAKLIDQAKERSRIQTRDIKDRTAERDTALQEKDTLQQQLNSLQAQLETAVREKESSEQQLKAISQELETIKSERDRALVDASQSAAARSTVSPAADATQQTSNEHLEQEIANLRQQVDEVTQEKRAIETELSSLKEQLRQANVDRDRAIADAAEARSSQRSATSNQANQDESEEGQVEESPKVGISDEERKALEERIAAAETRAKEQEEKAVKLEEQVENTLKTRSDKMKAALNKKLAESREAQKAELEAEYQLKLEQDKKIWFAENKPAATAAPPINPFAVTPVNPFATTPVTAPEPLQVPATPSQPKTEDTTTVPATPVEPPTPTQRIPELSDEKIRELLSTNPTAKSIIVSNVRNKMIQEKQKLDEEYKKQLLEQQQKAESTQASAVFMTEKKNSLKLNMAENRIKTANGKLEIVETAARDTPQRPVVEVWELTKAYKPPPPTPAPAQQNGTASSLPKTADAKPESTPAASGAVETSSQAASITPGQNSPPGLPPSQIPMAPTTSNAPQRGSGIPTMRGGPANRARGGTPMYQAGRGAGGPGRGRGNNPVQRSGSLNAGAQPYSPQGQVGQKRPREDGSIGGPQGNSGKRPRGGGPAGGQNI
ncbi:putative Nucleoprotein TPR [Glarea lozoyensis 74030]|uniref:Putative Nucleoprotein TPR n=1 Tax=Glarea lozoyensis (strain ATCC 74030 / MF5533) TaxID=1104152 RepID=H0EM56_GLAL7|nr:putative Nucleoprotein TPR [Glarea lozoyensis 74030]